MTESLEALNRLFEHAGIFVKRDIGHLGAITVYAPESLSYGGVLALAWLWSKHSGDFTLNDIWKRPCANSGCGIYGPRPWPNCAEKNQIGPRPPFLRH